LFRKKAPQKDAASIPNAITLKLKNQLQKKISKH
jgi:hypothetical protein